MRLLRAGKGDELCGSAAATAAILPDGEELSDVVTINATVAVDIGVEVTGFPIDEEGVDVGEINTGIEVEVGGAGEVDDTDEIVAVFDADVLRRVDRDGGEGSGGGPAPDFEAVAEAEGEFGVEDDVEGTARVRVKEQVMR